MYHCQDSANRNLTKWSPCFNSAKFSYSTLCLDVDPIQAIPYLNGRSFKLLNMKRALTRIQLKDFTANISNNIVWRTSDFLGNCTLLFCLSSLKAWWVLHLRA